MNKYLRNLLMLLLFNVLIMSSGITAADTIGAAGSIDNITLNSTASDDYGLYHGFIIVSSKVDDVRYNWGGSYCPGLSLFTDQNKYLLNALIDYSHSKVTIEPRFKVGQGGSLCLVSFTGARK